MGTFRAEVHVRSHDVDAIRSAMVAAGSTNPRVTLGGGGWSRVVDDRVDSHDLPWLGQLAGALSRIGADGVGMMVHDSDVLMVWLARAGAVVCQVEVGSLTDDDPEVPISDVDALLAACVEGTTAADLHAIVAQDYVFVDDVWRHLAIRLGIDDEGGDAAGFNELRGALQAALQGKLVISICAGVTLGQLAAWCPGARYIRAMPNTPALISEGMTVVSPGAGVSDDDLELALGIFRSVGRCRVLDAKYLDAVTGLSGSGPAFACVMLEALADGGVMMGLPRDVAVELAAQTMQGAARMVLETGDHPAALRDRVTTPAGCTIAGLFRMEEGRIRSTLAQTVQVAAKKASTLGDG